MVFTNHDPRLCGGRGRGDYPSGKVASPTRLLMIRHTVVMGRRCYRVLASSNLSVEIRRVNKTRYDQYSHHPIYRVPIYCVIRFIGGKTIPRSRIYSYQNPNGSSDLLCHPIYRAQTVSPEWPSKSDDDCIRNNQKVNF